MRKFLWVVAVGALVFAMAAPAMALDFKFGSEYRVRFTTGVNNGFVDAPGTNARSIHLRVRPRFDVSDDNGNIQATLRLEIGDVEFGNGGGASGETNGVSLSGGSARVGPGAGGSFGNDGVNVETKWAYIDWMMPFGIPLRVRAGAQPWFLPKGLLVDDDAYGIRAYGKVNPVSYEAFWYRLSGGPNRTAVPAAGTAGVVTTSNLLDNNYDIYGGKLDVAIMPWLNPGVYYFYADNRVNCTGEPGAGTPACADRVREGHYVGVTVTGKVGIVSYDVDWAYGTADGGPTGALGGAATPIKVKGWAADAAVHFPLGPVTINIAGSYGTGDKRDGGDSEAFPSLAASWNGPGGGFEMIGSGGPFDQIEFTQDSPVNLWTIGGWVTYNPVKALTLKAGAAYAGFSRTNGNCANAGGGLSGSCFGPSYTRLSNAAPPAGNGTAEDSLGTEVHLRADYEIWTGFKLQGQAGWLIPSSGDTAAEYVFQMYYNF
ncbi:MAG: hypothetical protein HY713_13775 [candidate division NC10 bacterium]|nr:hypothetical protein [candidate division NC10 bacterium]